MNTRALKMWSTVAAVFAGAVLAACAGGSHAVPPASNSSQTQAAPSNGGNAALALRIPAATAMVAAQGAARAPQYVSGNTRGVYLAVACSGSCASSPAPTAAFAKYIDVSPTSPLCGGSTSTPVTAPYTCTVGLNLQGGYSYSFTAALLNQAPLGSSGGFGTGFCTGGGTVFGTGTCTGAGAVTLAVAAPPYTISPIATGVVNTFSATFWPVAVEFASVNALSSGGVQGTDGVRTRPAYGAISVDYTFEAGDASGNLITAASGCNSSQGGALGENGCEPFADPFGGNTFTPVINTGTGPAYYGTAGSTYETNEDAITLYSDTSTALGTFDYAPHLWPASCSTCFSGNSDNGSTFTPFTQALPAPGILDATFVWDGTPAEDDYAGCSTLSGPAPNQACYGVPLLIDLSNNVPCTSGFVFSGGSTCSWGTSVFHPLVYNSSETCTTDACNYTGGFSFYLAPFEVVLSCGSNSNCGTEFSQGVNQANATSGTIALTAYQYHSGFDNNGYSSTCYASSTPYSTVTAGGCLTVANGQGSPGGAPASSCYSSGTCVAANSSTTTGLSYCYPPNYTGTLGAATGAVASIQLNVFTEGANANQFSSTGNRGIADQATFTITPLQTNTTCSFQIQNARGPNQSATAAYSAVVTISTSTSGTPINITIPTPQPLQ